MSATYRALRRRWAARQMILTRWIASPGTIVEFGAHICEFDVDGQLEIVSNDDDERLPWGIYWRYVDAGQEVGADAALFEYTYDVRTPGALNPPCESHQAVFLSSRQIDAGDSATRLHEALAGALGGAGSIFFEPVNPERGRAASWSVQQAVVHCRLMVVLIGPTWMSGTDDRGHRWLDAETDHVRRAVTAGLDRGIPMLPVLLSGATAPTYELPIEMRGFELLQMVPLRRERWDSDLEQLIMIVRDSLA